MPQVFVNQSKIVLSRRFGMRRGWDMNVKASLFSFLTETLMALDLHVDLYNA